MLIWLLSYPLVAIWIRFLDTHAEKVAEIAYAIGRVWTFLHAIKPVELHPSLEHDRGCCGREVVLPIVKVAGHPRSDVQGIH